MNIVQRTAADVEEGMALPELVKQPTHTMLFRFSAVTWNAHRIHYDLAYAKSEKHPDVLVQATMHGGFLLQMLSAFVGPSGQILRFKYSNRAKAVPGEVLICGGRVLSVDRESGEIECEIWEKKQDGTVCAPGSARLRLPQAASGAA